jgi:hypothetical protein
VVKRPTIATREAASAASIAAVAPARRGEPGGHQVEELAERPAVGIGGHPHITRDR